MSSGTTTGSIHGASSAIGTVCAAGAPRDSQVPLPSTFAREACTRGGCQEPIGALLPGHRPLTCGFVIDDRLGGRCCVVPWHRRKGKCAHEVRGRRDCRLPPSRGCTD